MTAPRDMPTKIFIVDDDPDDRLLIEKALQTAALDCDSVMFSSGQELLDALVNGASPELVLLDLNMPVVNGYQVLNALRQQNRMSHIPVVVLSTSSQSSDREKALALGARQFVTKPSSVRVLATALAEIFRDLGVQQGDLRSP